MRIGVLGTGTVGRTLASGLVGAGHEVRMGSRSRGNEKAVAWAAEAGRAASEGSFADAAEFGELVVNATAGSASLEALRACGPDALAGKVLLDVANPLDFSGGMPPALTVCNTDSLAEQIQRELPDTRVVKALNTVNAALMSDPRSLPDAHTIFMAGDDAAAKEQVAELLHALGWRADEVLDLGDVSAARGMEMYLPLWLRMFGTLGTPAFNVKVVHG